jgi:hypothetical protein
MSNRRSKPVTAAHRADRRRSAEARNALYAALSITEKAERNPGRYDVVGGQLRHVPRKRRPVC